MVILHFAKLNARACSGVEVVVPKYIYAQSKDNFVGLINVNKKRILEDKYDISNRVGYRQLEYDIEFDIKKLEKPFDRPDIVVFQECYVIDFIKISRNLRKYNIPYIIVPHGELQKEAQQRKYLKKFIANNTIFRNFISKTRAIQCLSEGEVKSTKFLVKKIVIENGMKIPLKQKIEFNKCKIDITYIGRLDMNHKGLDMLVKAVSTAQQELRSAKCTISIYGPDKDSMKNKLEMLIKKYSIEDIICVKNPLYGIEKENILLSSDIFIQTSRFEGMPMGVLEALSYGIPCLLTKGTNLGIEVEKANAGWCASNNVESIAEKILQAIRETRLYKDKGNKARLLIENKYNWDNITKKTIEVYRTIIDEYQ